MSTEAFTLCLVVASALLALWIVARLPKLRPQSRSGFAIAFVATAIVVTGTPAAIRAAGAWFGTLPAILLVALPLCTYLFLVVAWIVLYLGGLSRPHVK